MSRHPAAARARSLGGCTRRPPSVPPRNTYAFVHELLGEDVHATRVLSLANGVVGVMHSAALGIHAIGRGLADALDP
ncbi:MAG: hypothetical protein U0235_24060 [Polyangiaceae bacterium]